jgi:hypothetical protein
MGRELVQRRKLQRRRYELVDDGIRAGEHTLLGGTTQVIPYDVMFGECVELRRSSQNAFWLALGAIGAAILFAIGHLLGTEDIEWYVAPLVALAAIPFGAYFLASRADLIWFHEGDLSLWVVRDQPSVHDVDAFLEEARARARARLRERLLPLLHTGNEYDDRQHAQDLRDKGVISGREYLDYLRERDKRAPEDNPN